MEREMKLTIFAATGGIGGQALAQAVAAGHDVTAVVRNPKKLSGKVRFVTADLAAPDIAALERAVEGARGSALRPWSTVSVRDRNRVAGHAGHRQGDEGHGCAAHRRGQRCADLDRTFTWPPEAAEARPGRQILHADSVQPVGKGRSAQAHADLARMEDILRDSGLNWTVVRPPRLTHKPLTGAYRLAYGQNLRGGFLISRANVAHHMLRVLEQPKTIQQAIGIAN